MAIVALNSVTDTRKEYLELFENWGASKLQTFLYCRVIGALYTIAGGLKIALPLALIGAVLGEFLGGSRGLGYVIVTSGANFRMDRSFGAIVILAIMGVTLLAIVRLTQEWACSRYKQE
jgi:NitT/TauT family transport system permease protein